MKERKSARPVEADKLSEVKVSDGSGRIRLMYELSGGCEYAHQCKDCTWYFEGEGKETENRSTGKKVRPPEPTCLLHPLGQSGGVSWKAGYMACKYFDSGFSKAKAAGLDTFEDESGQMTFR